MLTIVALERKCPSLIRSPEQPILHKYHRYIQKEIWTAKRKEGNVSSNEGTYVIHLSDYPLWQAEIGLITEERRSLTHNMASDGKQLQLKNCISKIYLQTNNAMDRNWVYQFEIRIKFWGKIKKKIYLLMLYNFKITICNRNKLTFKF